jgi:lysophospholipase L1-like esterase
VTARRPTISRNAALGTMLGAALALAGCAGATDRPVTTVETEGPAVTSQAAAAPSSEAAPPSLAAAMTPATASATAPAVTTAPAAARAPGSSRAPAGAATARSAAETARSAAPAATTVPAAATAPLVANAPAAGAVRGGPLRLVTLGDTYTSGYPLGPQYSWPAQLVRALEPEIVLTLAGNLAAQGQTSANVIAEQLWDLPGRRPQVVTIQVGANDIISPDIDLADYRTNIGTILDELLDVVPAGRIFAISTPDFTLTPHGGDFGSRTMVRGEIREANAILADEAERRGIAFIEIAPVSDRVTQDPTLVGADGLSPSAKQYAGWVELIAPRLRAALRDSSR